MWEYIISADFESWEEIAEKITECLSAAGCTEKSVFSFLVAAEEIFANISQHAYRKGAGTVRIRFFLSADRSARLEFWDSGKRFDPTEVENPDITAACGKRKIGGMGIYMAREKTDAMFYEYRDNQNHLTLVKKF